jgi:hypothetical protein
MSALHSSTLLLPRQTAGDTGEFIFYHYAPSMPAAIVFIVLFALSTGFHYWQMIRTRTWFMIPFSIGAICESTCSPEYCVQCADHS